MSAFKKADILLPQGVDLSKWSVVACDQYTSQKDYWEDVEKIVGDSPSTLNITFPEVYLSEGDKRIEKINQTMDKYMDMGLFKKFPQSLIYVERTIDGNKVRRGIVGAIDLDKYDFSVGSESLVRATEGTVLERIPPRVKIRENAPLELPHVMILIDDEAQEVIEHLTPITFLMEKVYDFELIKGGGHLTGYLIPDEIADQVIEKISVFENQETFNNKYGITNKSPLAYAVGDGNHSLATAKTCWENLKKTLSPEEQENHPARFALCEIENIHDTALEFEPIHRVVFDVDVDDLLKNLGEFYDLSDNPADGQCIEYISEKGEGKVYVKNPKSQLVVGTLQIFLDNYLKGKNSEIDYIHGDDVCRDLGKKPGNIGFILPPMAKSDLFLGVIKDGVLPRKTFSMGEAYEKRFYLEAKLIK